MNQYKAFIKKLSDDNMERYKHEFSDFRINFNIERCEELGKVLIILNLVLILVDLLIYKPLRSETSSYLYLYYSHMLMLTLVIAWFILLRFHREYGIIKNKRVLYVILMIITMLWGIFLGLNGLFISGQISAYIVCVFGISVCLNMDPLESFLTHSISLCIFISGLYFLVDSKEVLYSHIVNSSILILISYMVSNLMYSGLIKDFINKKKLIEAKSDLEAANQKLKESEELRTVFFANISHELRTPLNVIYCAQQMMGNALEQDECSNVSVLKYLKLIKQNSFRLLRLIGNLIDITKIDASSFDVKLVNADIIKVVEDITMSVATYVENKGLIFTFDTEVEERIIACDPDKIERIMLNLLSNAVKFTDKGGSILVNIYLEEGKVLISVKDTGIGIPADMKQSIFDRFVQVDKSSAKKVEGSGIGLSLVRALVEMHKGNIQVDSTPGEGSEFIIMLPDVIISDYEKVEVLQNIDDSHVKKISIEFSDIYE